MTRPALILATLIGMMVGSVAGARAETTADVRTRAGLSLRLSQPSVEVTYTIVPPRSGDGPAPGPAPAGAPAPGLGMLGSGGGGGGAGEPQLSGSVTGLAKMFKPTTDTLRARREKDSLTLFRGGSEIQVPIDRVSVLTVFRTPVSNSPLPPYVATSHVRHTVVVVLTDGSAVQGEYVNFGTAVLSGTTPQGRVEIPLEDVERVHFNR
jgi:hypothetical protein